MIKVEDALHAAKDIYNRGIEDLDFFEAGNGKKLTERERNLAKKVLDNYFSRLVTWIETSQIPTKPELRRIR